MRVRYVTLPPFRFDFVLRVIEEVRHPARDVGELASSSAVRTCSFPASTLLPRSVRCIKLTMQCISMSKRAQRRLNAELAMTCELF